MQLLVNPSVLASNPGFDVLYRDLGTNKLNEDGTTKLDAKQQKERDAFNEELRRARVLAAKRNFIKSYFPTLAYRCENIPEELQELVTVIAAVCHANLTDEDADLLKDDVEKFKTNLAPVARAMSKSIEEDLVSLGQIASPVNPIEGRKLARYIEKLKLETADLEEQLASARMNLAEGAVNVHVLQRKVIEASVRILEQTIHGSVSRGTRAKVDYLATVAEGMNKKLQLQQHQLTVAAAAPELEEALEARSTQLDREVLTLKRRTREAEDEFAAYRQSKAVESMAKEFAEILHETEKVTQDIARLEKQNK